MLTCSYCPLNPGFCVTGSFLTVPYWNHEASNDAVWGVSLFRRQQENIASLSASSTDIIHRITSLCSCVQPSHVKVAPVTCLRSSQPPWQHKVKVPGSLHKTKVPGLHSSRFAPLALSSFLQTVYYFWNEITANPERRMYREILIF